MVGLHGFFVMVLRVQNVSVCELCMMRGLFVMTGFAVLCCFSVVFGRFFVVPGRLGMLFVSVRHWSLPETRRSFGKICLTFYYDGLATRNALSRTIQTACTGSLSSKIEFLDRFPLRGSGDFDKGWGLTLEKVAILYDGTRKLALHAL
ncbi:MAG: hypothetical protein ACLPJW_11190 [Rhodomicrobium sp.]